MLNSNCMLLIHTLDTNTVTLEIVNSYPYLAHRHTHIWPHTQISFSSKTNFKFLECVGILLKTHYPWRSMRVNFSVSYFELKHAENSYTKYCTSQLSPVLKQGEGVV